MFFLRAAWNRSWILFRPATSQGADGLSADLGCAGKEHVVARLH